ncbi:hypothetical protein MMC34_006397 [Xylographa carneopallida]|nr:hypothetical protein [Xylographa carneopallida]
MDEKQRKKQAKEEKQLLIAQRKAARENAALQRRVERDEQIRLRKEALEARAADRQLELDIQKVIEDENLYFFHVFFAWQRHNQFSFRRTVDAHVVSLVPDLYASIGLLITFTVLCSYINGDDECAVA